jgi:hypothetical protein
MTRLQGIGHRLDPSPRMSQCSHPYYMCYQSLLPILLIVNLQSDLFRDTSARSGLSHIHVGHRASTCRDDYQAVLLSGRPGSQSSMLSLARFLVLWNLYFISWFQMSERIASCRFEHL